MGEWRPGWSPLNAEKNAPGEAQAEAKNGDQGAFGHVVYTGNMLSKDLVAYCRKLPHAVEDIKWGNDRVFSIYGGKMFCVFSMEQQSKTRMSFKVAEHRFLEMTDRPQFIPAPYMARAHWVALVDENGISKQELEELVRASYDWYFSKLSKKAQRELQSTTY